jgi:hypothetical protein
MKVVQVGILIALVVVGVLLFLVYKQQSAAPRVEPQAAIQGAPAAALPVPAQPAPATAAQTAPPAAPLPAETVEKKPARPWRKASAAPKAPREPQEAPPAAEAASVATPPAAAPPSTPPPAAQNPLARTPPSAPAAPPEAPASPPTVALTPPSGTESTPRQPHRVTIPAGTLLSVRLAEALSTDRQNVGDAFSANLDQPLVVEGFVIGERGARVEGRVLEAEKAGRLRGTATLAIHLVKLHTSDGQEMPILTQKFVKEGETSRREDATKVGAGAAIGAAIGAIAGGGKGAAIGAAVGGAAGGGTVAATRGKPAVLPSETRISFRLQEAVTLTEKIR